MLAVILAGGLATQGAKPVVAIYSTFLQRGYDNIVHDVAIQSLPVIFDAFAQEGDWVTSEFGGLGLGLAIAKATVEAHHGTLTASSAGRTNANRALRSGFCVASCCASRISFHAGTARRASSIASVM